MLNFARFSIPVCASVVWVSATLFCAAKDPSNAVPASKVAETPVSQASELEMDSIWRSKPVSAWVSVLEKSVSNAKRKPPIREQWYAAYALGMYGPDAKSAVPVLLKRLALDAGSDDDVRACIVYALAQIGDEKAFSSILEMLDSPYPIIERTAALALARFPKQLAQSSDALKKMKSVLSESSTLQLPLAANCAAALWAANEHEDVLAWIQKALRSEREDDFTKNFELYLAISVVQQILDSEGTDAFAQKSEEIASLLAATLTLSRDTDVILACCDALIQLKKHAVPAVMESYEKKENSRLLYVLACTDADSEKTQNLLFRTVSDAEKNVKLRVSAIRGLAFLPQERWEDAQKQLVSLINDPEITPTLANEAQIVLKQFGKQSSASF